MQYVHKHTDVTSTKYVCVHAVADDSGDWMIFCICYKYMNALHYVHVGEFLDSVAV